MEKTGKIMRVDKIYFPASPFCPELTASYPYADGISVYIAQVCRLCNGHYACLSMVTHYVYYVSPCAIREGSVQDEA